MKKIKNYIWTPIIWLDVTIFVCIGFACIAISYGIPLLIAYYHKLL